MSWIVIWVFYHVEFQYLVDGHGMSFAGGIFSPQASKTCCDIPSLLGFPSLISSSPCEAVMAGMDLAAVKFFWVRLPNEKFRPGESSSVPVLARPPNRRCCHLFWYAEFPSRQLYSSSWVGLKCVMALMAPVTGGYKCNHYESDLVGLPP